VREAAAAGDPPPAGPLGGPLGIQGNFFFWVAQHFTDGSVALAPPAWAQRLARVDGPSIAFFDEFSTASPALQAAALRPLTHFEVGSLQLPDTVSFVAAANPADVAAAGWELAAPTA